MASPNRRDFLLVAGGAASAIAGFGVCRAVSMYSAPVDLTFALEEFLSSGAFSPELGQRYIALQGLERGGAYRTLTKQVMESVADGDVRNGIRKQMALDFERGNLCNVDGWQLSLTECQVAGLTFLFRQRGGYVAETAVTTDSPIEHFPEWEIAEFGLWGPKSCLVNEPFNVQADGHSALWFHVDEIDRNPYQIHIGPHVARTVINPEAKLISASVSAEQVRRLVSRVGEVPIHLVDPARGKQFVGHLDVRSKPIESL